MKKKWVLYGTIAVAALVVIVAVVAIALHASKTAANLAPASETVIADGGSMQAPAGYDELASMPSAADADQAGAATGDAAPTVDANVAAKVQELCQQVATLAPEYGMAYDPAADKLTGKGLRQEGVPVAGVMTRLATAILGPNGKEIVATDEIRKLLEELKATPDSASPSANPDTTPSTVASLSADTSKQDVSGIRAAKQKEAAAALVEANAEETLVHPPKVYGDWISVREEYDRHSVEHSTDYYEYIQFHYNGTATFIMYRNKQAINRTRFTYRYDATQGKVSLFDSAGKVVETYEVWAPKLGPEYGDTVLKLWMARPGIAMRTVYEKVDNGGEPVTEEDILRGLRLYGGEAAVQQYLERKAKYKTQ